jgi:hypothetical protein
MTDCITLNLFGVADPYVKDIEIGDYCLLYNYSDKNVYGVWKADSKCGVHNSKAWGGKFKFQTKVELVSKTLNSIPFEKLKSLLTDNGKITWKYYGEKAQVLIQYYASEYSSKIKFGELVHAAEEDYRKKYPATFHCTDGHDVRSQSEQTIDNWLYNHRIPHAYEPIVAIPEQLIPDFQVPAKTGESVFIEFWGMVDEPSYKERMLRKSQIYAKYNMQLIEIRPNDLKNFDFFFLKKLQSKNVL